MSILPSNVLCPYCLNPLHSWDVKMTCPECETEAKGNLITYLTHSLPKCQVPNCRKHVASVCRCKQCGAKLPADILDYEKYLRFSILGVTGAGKTNFLTTMLHELREYIGSPWVIAPMDPTTTSTYQRYNDMIYTKRIPVPMTDKGMPPVPQQWKIKDRNKMSATRISTYSLTIFDGAGEDCAHIDPTISRYINGSKTLIILIDPLSLPNVRRTVDANVVSWSTTAKHGSNASTDMVNQLADYIRASCRMPSAKLIDRNVAVVFTKLDAVAKSFGSATVMQSSPHMSARGFVKTDADAVHAEIRDWLEGAGESSFLDAIDTNFRKGKVRFFGVSSFGQPPMGNGKLGAVVPHRVLDPLLWALSMEHVVPEK
ncbi:MAG: hypothetical protein IJY28_00870 [Clostridia bacterium]|nr:hypothetical protein [Clostridia bacterium]